jgi:IclR helix-turn-helix domain
MGLLMQVIGAKTTGLQLALAAAPPAPTAPAPPHAPVTREEAGSLIMAVYLTVQRLQPCTNAQVKDALGAPRNTVHRALQDLQKQGKVRKEGQTYGVVEASEGAA